MKKVSYTTLRLILGDQLNYNHSWFQKVEKEVLYVIAELHQEQTYVSHHVQKVCAFSKVCIDFHYLWRVMVTVSNT